jgi:LmbE family N-acetylglucosaminyl deacetylase
VNVLHVAPHPDDEAIGAPATLLGLIAGGHRVVNLACSLGRPDQHERRRREVTEACRRAGFELEILDPPLRISRDDDLERAQRTLAGEVRRRVEALDAGLVIGPTPHDGHHGHEVVGRAVRDALAAEAAPPLWMWAIWAELPLPTLFVPFEEQQLERATDALSAHAGEVARNDYADLLRGRGVTSRVLGAERVFGFGSPRRAEEPYAELLADGGPPRVLDLEHPLGP